MLRCLSDVLEGSSFIAVWSVSYFVTVLGTDLGEQRCFKFLITQFVSLNKTKIICSMTDQKPFFACGFCVVKISPVIGFNTINNPDIF